MKTIPLRQLVRETSKVKRWTRAGQTVHVTDNGQPLWTIQPALTTPTKEEERERARAIDEILDEVLREPRSPISAAALLEQSRR